MIDLNLFLLVIDSLNQRRLCNVQHVSTTTICIFGCREFLQFIIRHYGHALEYGSKYIYQCMPRMLSLWLDFGSNVPDGSIYLITNYN